MSEAREAYATGRASLEEVVFFVPGVPVPKGSGEGTQAQRRNRKRRRWRENLGVALPRVRPLAPWSGPVGVSVVFWLEGDLLTPPDADKLLRFVLDELTGEFYTDDAQVISSPPALAGAEKCWLEGDPQVVGHRGASIRVRQLPADRMPHGDDLRWSLLPHRNAAPELGAG